MQFAIGFTALALFLAQTGCSGDTEFAGQSERRKSATVAKASSAESEDAVPKAEDEAAPRLGDAAPRLGDVAEEIDPNDPKVLVTLEDNPLLTKVFFIVDDSSSMVDRQEVLKRGILSLKGAFVGRKIEAHVYSSSLFRTGNHFLTESKLPGGTKGYFALPGGKFGASQWKQKFVYMDAQKREQPWTMDMLNTVLPEVVFEFDLYPSLIAGEADGVVRLQGDEDPATFDARFKRLADAMVLGSDGSDAENPTCTLIRLLLAKENKVLAPGDRAAFVYLTDEDDTPAGVGGCVAGVRANIVRNPTKLVSVPYKLVQMRMDYGARDGGGVTYLRGRTWLPQTINWTPGNPDFPTWNEADEGKSFPCTPSQRAIHKRWFESAYAAQIASGAYRLDDDAACVLSYYFAHHEFSIPFENDCSSPYVRDNVTYPTIIDYAFAKGQANLSYLRRCVVTRDSAFSMVGPTGGKGVGGSGVIPYGAFDPNDKLAVANFASAQLEAKLGRGNYFIGGILNDPMQKPASCTTRDDSKSQAIMSLIDKGPTPGNWTSICAPDYSKTLDRLKAFVTRAPKRVFDVSAFEGRQVMRMEIHRGGDVLTMADDAWKIEDDQLSISYADLREGDVLVPIF